MTAALAWLRRTPVLGWLAVAVVAIVLYALRQRRRALAAEAATAVQRRLLHVRAELERAEVRADREATSARAEAEAELHAAEAQFTAAQERLAGLEGQALADELDAVFGPRKRGGP